MGLAPYGKDTYVEQIQKILALKNGKFQLNMSYFKPLGSNQGMQILPDGTVRLARHFSDKMEKLFGAPREPHAEIMALQHLGRPPRPGAPPQPVRTVADSWIDYGAKPYRYTRSARENRRAGFNPRGA